MARKSKQPVGDTKNTLRLNRAEYESKSIERIEAESAQSPIHANAQTARTFSRGTFGVSDLTESVAILAEKAATVRAGDLSGAEEMLTAHATALDAIFNEMARRAAINMGEHLGATETYLRLAFKAQGQCRATLQTLAEVKNPRPVAFVKQANISHGPQQVNNGPNFESSTRTHHAHTHAHAANSVIQSNELLEVTHGERLDTRAPGTAGTANPQLETVGEIDRPANG